MGRINLDNYNPNKESSIEIDTEKYAIQVPSLNFDFGGPLILKDIKLNIINGSCNLLVGANGAGKSTLLRILAGKRMIHSEAYVLGKRAFVDRPDGVTYLGIEWANNPATKLDIKVSYLIKSVGGDKYSDRRDELIQLLDVDPNWHMHQVSDGERRRVQLVIGLLAPWKVLLLDEVTVDLDVMVRSNLFDFLKKEVQTRNATIIYATHILDGLASWPSHILHIHKGTILKTYDLKHEQINNEPIINNNQIIHPNFKERLTEFPELLDAIIHTQEQLNKGEIADSPLLKVVEKWLRLDFIDRLKQGDVRAHSKTKWEELSEDMDKYGDKYYNYWK